MQACVYVCIYTSGEILSPSRSIELARVNHPCSAQHNRDPEQDSHTKRNTCVSTLYNQRQGQGGSSCTQHFRQKTSTAAAVSLPVSPVTHVAVVEKTVVDGGPVCEVAPVLLLHRQTEAVRRGVPEHRLPPPKHIKTTEQHRQAPATPKNRQHAVLGYQSCAVCQVGSRLNKPRENQGRRGGPGDCSTHILRNTVIKILSLRRPNETQVTGLKNTGTTKPDGR